MFPMVISFYTTDTLYQLEVQNLIESCQRYGVAHQIEGVGSFGSWELNCAYKPFFIYRKLQELQRPVLWIDADGMFIRSPQILEVFKKDFAVRINEELQVVHPSKVISSTIYANYTSGACRLLQTWAHRCHNEITRVDRKEEFWDQMALRDALYFEEHGADFETLPREYTKIIDHPGDQEHVLEPVIEHYQASRRYKKMINQEGLFS